MTRGLGFKGVVQLEEPCQLTASVGSSLVLLSLLSLQASERSIALRLQSAPTRTPISLYVRVNNPSRCMRKTEYRLMEDRVTH